MLYLFVGFETVLLDATCLLLLVLLCLLIWVWLIAFVLLGL